MKTYEVQWVRIEHQVTLIEVKANDEDEAAEKAKAIAHSAPFGAYEFDVVHADEFVNDIECLDEVSE